MTRMCAFPSHGTPVVPVLTDRSYRVITRTFIFDLGSLPVAWDRARELAEADPADPPQVWAVFDGVRHDVLMADWAEDY